MSNYVIAGFATFDEGNRCICMCPYEMGAECELSDSCTKFTFELSPVEERSGDRITEIDTTTVDSATAALSVFNKAVIETSKSVNKTTSRLNDLTKIMAGFTNK